VKWTARCNASKYLWGWKPPTPSCFPKTETLQLNEHAILNAPFIIVAYDCRLMLSSSSSSSYCTEIRTAHFEIPNRGPTHFCAPKHTISGTDLFRNFDHPTVLQLATCTEIVHAEKHERVNFGDQQKTHAATSQHRVNSSNNIAK